MRYAISPVSVAAELERGDFAPVHERFADQLAGRNITYLDAAFARSRVASNRQQLCIPGKSNLTDSSFRAESITGGLTSG